MSSRFTKKDLTERQLKSFKTMYEDLTYSSREIQQRFGISHSTLLDLARDLDLKIRPQGGKQ